MLIGEGKQQDFAGTIRCNEDDAIRCKRIGNYDNCSMIKAISSLEIYDIMIN